MIAHSLPQHGPIHPGFFQSTMHLCRLLGLPSVPMLTPHPKTRSNKAKQSSHQAFWKSKNIQNIHIFATSTCCRRPYVQHKHPSLSDTARSVVVLKSSIRAPSLQDHKETNPSPFQLRWVVPYSTPFFMLYLSGKVVGKMLPALDLLWWFGQISLEEIDMAQFQSEVIQKSITPLAFVTKTFGKKQSLYR